MADMSCLGPALAGPTIVPVHIHSPVPQQRCAVFAAILTPQAMASSASRGWAVILSLLCCICFLQAGVQGTGPCAASSVSISVSKPADFLLRLKYPPTQSVKLVLQNNLWLRSSLVLDQGYACSIVTSSSYSGLNGFTIGYAISASFPLVLVANTSNLLLTRLVLSSDACTAQCDRTQLGLDYGPGNLLPCPAAYVHRSWGITISHSTISGRVDFVRALQSRLESSSISIKGTTNTGMCITMCGDGPSRISSQVFVTNNKFSGGEEGILLTGGAVGVTIQNNEFRNHVFTGIQCGRGYTNAGDCMMTKMERNVITTDPTFTPVTDASGIYFATHWVNPGNTLTCNYVVGGRHCIYLDYTSSGIVVDGAVCVNTYDGIKLNAGHSNTISSVVAVNNTGLAGWMSCQNYDLNNCKQTPGSAWESKRKAYYSSSSFRYAYPWLTDFCLRTSAGGVNCNPSGGATAQQTGACSGMPTGNVMELSIVDARHLPPWNSPDYRHCELLPAVPKMNVMKWKNYWTAGNSLGGQVKPPWDNVAFINPAAGDYGLQSSSVIRSQYSGLRSCPRPLSGAKPISLAAALSFYNVYRKVPLNF